MLRQLLLLAACAAGLTAFAQEVASLDGAWKVKFTNPGGFALEADVKITATTGTWQLLAKSRYDPCTGREFPFQIANGGAEGFDLALNRSKALAGCRDSVYRMHRVDDKTYESAFEDGRKFQLVRQ